MKKVCSKMPDWLKRTIKTFIETFFGVVIAGISTTLSGVPLKYTSILIALSPLIISAFSAAITAAWNIVIEKMNNNGN